jgi:MFS family permease
MFGDTLMLIVLSMWVKTLTGSNGAAGVTFLWMTAPALLAPAFGYLVDRVPRRQFLVVANLASALMMLPLLLVHDAGDVWIIYAVATVYGASYTLLASGQSALLTTLLDKEQLATANAVLQTVREGLRLVAPVAGAGLYTVAGGGAVAILDAATFLAATAALLALKVREPKPEPGHEPWHTAFVAGVRHIRRTPVLRRMMIGCGVSLLVIGFSETLVYELPQALGKPPSFVGVLMAVQGVGAIAGALTATKVMRRRGENALAGLGMTIFAIGALLMADSLLPVILAGKLLFGLGLPWIVIGLVTLVQRATPGPLQGRVYAAGEFALGAPQTLSIALGAGLVALVDYRVVLLLQAVVAAGCGVYLLNKVPIKRRPR